MLNAFAHARQYEENGEKSRGLKKDEELSHSEQEGEIAERSKKLPNVRPC